MSKSAKPDNQQRLHDLRGTHADFKAVLRLLQSGYRFDDADAPAALMQLEKAVHHLEEQLKLLEVEWEE